MSGEIGSFFKGSAGADDKKLVKGIFQDTFQTKSNWKSYFASALGGENIEALLNKSSAAWTVKNFQGLYVACWIFHPVEKGSYMLRIDGGSETNVVGAYDRLLKEKKLQERISSHLGGKGASAHEGWSFLQGYDELLLQIDAPKGGTPYLFLKCEGHAMDGAFSTMMHGLSWAKKKVTGSGKTASAALHEYANSTSTVVEARAAENYSPAYEKFLKQLGLTGTLVTVAMMLDKMLLKCGSGTQVPAETRGNSVQLGSSMLGLDGYISKAVAGKGQLAKNKVDLGEDVLKELTAIANRLWSGSSSHPAQYFNEVRVTAAELTEALRQFDQFST